MTSSLRATIISIAGVLIFGIGAWIRFHAEDLGSITLPDGNRMITHSHEYIEIARPLIWCGGALIVLSSAGWLFHAPQFENSLK
jgi:hypothetical protein